MTESLEEINSTMDAGSFFNKCHHKTYPLIIQENKSNRKK